MNTFKLRNAVLVAAIAGALAACGGGGDTPATAAGAFTGIVADGYISGAMVTLDDNDDGVCTAVETTATTLATGAFTFAGKSPHMVCVTGGTDLATGQTFVGELKAPAPATGTTTLVTPLTTLVVAQVQADKAIGITTLPAAAATVIATKFGLTGDLLAVDPALPATAAANPKLTQTTAAVQTLLVQAAQSVASAATGLAPSDAQTKAMYHSAAVGLAKAAKDSVAAVDLTATAAVIKPLVNAAIQNTVTEAQATFASVNTDAAVVANKAAMAAAFTTTTVTATAALAATQALAPASVATVAADTVANMTQQVADTSAANLATTGGAATVAATVTQMATSFADTVASIADMLTTTVATALGGTATTAPAALSTFGADVLSAIPTSGVAGNLGTLNAAIASAVASAASGVGGAPGVSVTAPPVAFSTLVLSSPTVNGQAVNTTTNSVTVVGPLTTATMTVAVSGTPTLPSTVSAGIGATEVGGNRVLKLLIDQVQVSCINSSTLVAESCNSTTSAIKVTVPSTAKLYAYGVNSAGVPSWAGPISNAASNVFTSSNGVVSVNWSNALTALQGQAGFANLSLVTGTFDVGVGLSGNIPLSKSSAGTPADPIIGTVPATAAFPNGGVFSGQGAGIRVIVLQ